MNPVQLFVNQHSSQVPCGASYVTGMPCRTGMPCGLLPRYRSGLHRTSSIYPVFPHLAAVPTGRTTTEATTAATTAAVIGRAVAPLPEPETMPLALAPAPKMPTSVAAGRRPATVLTQLVDMIDHDACQTSPAPTAPPTNQHRRRTYSRRHHRGSHHRCRHYRSSAIAGTDFRAYLVQDYRSSAIAGTDFRAYLV